MEPDNPLHTIYKCLADAVDRGNTKIGAVTYRPGFLAANFPESDGLVRQLVISVQPLQSMVPLEVPATPDAVNVDAQDTPQVPDDVGCFVMQTDVSAYPQSTKEGNFTDE